MGDTSLRSSARLLLTRAARRWGLAVSSVTASVVGWVLYAFNVQGIPLWTFQLVAAALILFAIVRAFHDLRLERDQLQSERDNLQHRIDDERAKATRHSDIRAKLGELVSMCEYYISALRAGAEVPSEDIQ